MCIVAGMYVITLVPWIIDVGHRQEITAEVGEVVILLRVTILGTDTKKMIDDEETEIMIDIEHLTDIMIGCSILCVCFFCVLNCDFYFYFHFFF